MGKILASSSSDGTIVSTGVDASKLAPLANIKTGPTMLGVDSNGNLYDTGLSPSDVGQTASLDPNVALITNGQGKLTAGGSSAAITALTSLHGRSSAYSKVMVTNGSGDASTSTITSAQLGLLIMYDEDERVLVSDLPALS